ncbi:hypothetical protein AVEN_128871-1 [Araneus ventricosus]|uniref:Uncharacterized protein n=1 Tax=Araneus ventricosus TaxID=182803 RepID=A0A4Y2S2F4_ARAVE|nr:hypothetical protein AVEN_82192-1 [Araneus ventricosus]GBN82175.1 hypothetical protein AVEN_128871-1 [Araneus ventricosus]
MGTLSMPIDEADETPKCSPGTSNTVSPFYISHVPNIKKRTTTRGRKATRSSLITGAPYKDQLTKSLEKSAPKKCSDKSVPGIRDRTGGRGGKTKGLQKRKFDPRNDTIHHRTHQTTMILPLWTAVMISTWISTMGINHTRGKQLASFVMQSSLKTLAWKCGLNVLCAKCGHT